jgi:hypothetical protein
LGVSRNPSQISSKFNQILLDFFITFSLNNLTFLLPILARNLRTSSMSPKQKSRPKSKSSPKNPATPNNVSAQLQQQQQQLAQLQAQLAQLTSAMTMVFY